MRSITRRFRAASSLAYSQALIALTEYARGCGDDFIYGPVVNVSALVQHGLTVTGPPDVVGRISDLLDREVPGLDAEDDLPL